MKRPVKLSAQLERSTSRADTPSVSARRRSCSSTDEHESIQRPHRQAPRPRQARWFTLLCALRVEGARRRRRKKRFDGGAALSVSRRSRQPVSDARSLLQLTTCRSMSRPPTSLRPCLDEPIECDPAGTQFHLATSRTESESVDAPMRRWRHSGPVDAREPEPRSAVRPPEHLMDRQMRQAACTNNTRT
jgi:hypothetical protein